MRIIRKSKGVKGPYFSVGGKEKSILHPSPIYLGLI